jgi:hypothetical protein
MKSWSVVTALVILIALGSALAQDTPKTDQAPEDPMARMMRMMDEMRGDMRHMQEQMGGMGPMRDRMGHMMMMMGDTRTMMDQHRAEMRAQCPAFQGSPAPGK